MIARQRRRPPVIFWPSGNCSLFCGLCLFSGVWLLVSSWHRVKTAFGQFNGWNSQDLHDNCHCDYIHINSLGRPSYSSSRPVVPSSHSYPSPSLSRNPGSISTRLSNFFHQSWKLFNGTTSFPPSPPAKLARKLNAFLMIRCASIFVEGGRLTTVKAVELESEVAFMVASCAETSSVGSKDMPTITFPGRPSPLARSASMSTSAAPLARPVALLLL